MRRSIRRMSRPTPVTSAATGRSAGFAASAARSGRRPFRAIRQASLAGERQSQCAAPRRQTGRSKHRADARRRWPPRAPRRHGRRRSIATTMRPSAASTRSNAWIARAHDAGHFAIDAKTNSIDPMQAELVGIALALAPERRLLHPARHKQSGDGARPVRRRPCAGPDQGRRRARGAEAAAGGSPGVLKIGHNIKFDAVMLRAARHHASRPSTTPC